MTGIARQPMLQVQGLQVRFTMHGRPFEVVRGIDLTLERGRTLCLVGESGCGKSVTALALIGLLPPNAAVSAGTVRFDGEDLTAFGERQWRALRSRRIAMIFQDPATALNPTMTLGQQIGDVLRFHLGLSRQAARARAVALLDRVRIPQARRRVDEYPFALSGGMRQRVMIAMALACGPDLVIADEPTTALDVTVQAEILGLLGDLREENGMSLLLITHDLGVVAETADDVAVMYAGRIVERGRVDRVLDWPEHPYTVGLLGALPTRTPGRPLVPIRGRVPLPSETPPGCSFAPRCPFAMDRCAVSPPLARQGEGHDAACWAAPLGGAA